jgi:putative aldouronate transport system substrate-binding protein
MCKGPFDVNIKDNGDGTYDRIETPEGMSQAQFRHLEAPGSRGVWALLEDMDTKMKKPPAQIEKFEAAQVYKPLLTTEKNIYPNLLFPEEDVARLKILKTDIITFIESSIPKFIIEGFTEASWNQYIKQLNDMGLEELLQIYQVNYDRYSKLD